MTLKRAGRGARRRPRPSPFVQGDLDGLCGVYAVVNAIRAIRPGLTKTEARGLFRALMTTLRAEDRGRVPLASTGLSLKLLNQTIVIADQYSRRKLGGRLLVRRVPRALAERWSVSVLWRLLDDRLRTGSVAILGLDGVHDHWTVAVAATPRTIRLSDSDGLCLLKRRNCRAKTARQENSAHHIHSKYVIFVAWRRGDKRARTT